VLKVEGHPPEFRIYRCRVTWRWGTRQGVRRKIKKITGGIGRGISPRLLLGWKQETRPGSRRVREGLGGVQTAASSTAQNPVWTPFGSGRHSTMPSGMCGPDLWKDIARQTDAWTTITKMRESRDDYIWPLMSTRRKASVRRFSKNKPALPVNTAMSDPGRSRSRCWAPKSTMNWAAS
jgi:hypothetical protein